MAEPTQTYFQISAETLELLQNDVYAQGIQDQMDTAITSVFESFGDRVRTVETLGHLRSAVSEIETIAIITGQETYGENMMPELALAQTYQSFLQDQATIIDFSVNLENFNGLKSRTDGMLERNDFSSLDISQEEYTALSPLQQQTINIQAQHYSAILDAQNMAQMKNELTTLVQNGDFDAVNAQLEALIPDLESRLQNAGNAGLKETIELASDSRTYETLQAFAAIGSILNSEDVLAAKELGHNEYWLEAQNKALELLEKAETPQEAAFAMQVNTLFQEIKPEDVSYDYTQFGYATATIDENLTDPDNAHLDADWMKAVATFYDEKDKSFSTNFSIDFFEDPENRHYLESLQNGVIPEDMPQEALVELSKWGASTARWFTMNTGVALNVAVGFEEKYGGDDPTAAIAFQRMLDTYNNFGIFRDGEAVWDTTKAIGADPINYVAIGTGALTFGAGAVVTRASAEGGKAALRYSIARIIESNMLSRSLQRITGSGVRAALTTGFMEGSAAGMAQNWAEQTAELTSGKSEEFNVLRMMISGTAEGTIGAGFAGAGHFGARYVSNLLSRPAADAADAAPVRTADEVIEAEADAPQLRNGFADVVYTAPDVAANSPSAPRAPEVDAAPAAPTPIDTVTPMPRAPMPGRPAAPGQPDFSFESRLAANPMNVEGIGTGPRPLRSPADEGGSGIGNGGKDIPEAPENWADLSDAEKLEIFDRLSANDGFEAFLRDAESKSEELHAAIVNDMANPPARPRAETPARPAQPEPDAAPAAPEPAPAPVEATITAPRRPNGWNTGELDNADKALFISSIEDTAVRNAFISKLKPAELRDVLPEMGDGDILSYAQSLPTPEAQTRFLQNLPKGTKRDDVMDALRVADTLNGTPDTPPVRNAAPEQPAEPARDTTPEAPETPQAADAADAAKAAETPREYTDSETIAVSSRFSNKTSDLKIGDLKARHIEKGLVDIEALSNLPPDRLEELDASVVEALYKNGNYGEFDDAQRAVFDTKFDSDPHGTIADGLQKLNEKYAKIDAITTSPQDSNRAIFGTTDPTWGQIIENAAADDVLTGANTRDRYGRHTIDGTDGTRRDQLLWPIYRDALEAPQIIEAMLKDKDMAEQFKTILNKHPNLVGKSEAESNRNAASFIVANRLLRNIADAADKGMSRKEVAHLIIMGRLSGLNKYFKAVIPEFIDSGNRNTLGVEDSLWRGVIFPGVHRRGTSSWFEDTLVMTKIVLQDRIPRFFGAGAGADGGFSPFAANPYREIKTSHFFGDVLGLGWNINSNGASRTFLPTLGGLKKFWIDQVPSLLLRRVDGMGFGRFLGTQNPITRFIPTSGRLKDYIPLTGHIPLLRSLPVGALTVASDATWLATMGSAALGVAATIGAFDKDGLLDGTVVDSFYEQNEDTIDIVAKPAEIGLMAPFDIYGAYSTVVTAPIATGVNLGFGTDYDTSYYFNGIFPEDYDGPLKDYVQPFTGGDFAARDWIMGFTLGEEAEKTAAAPADGTDPDAADATDADKTDPDASGADPADATDVDNTDPAGTDADPADATAPFVPGRAPAGVTPGVINPIDHIPLDETKDDEELSPTEQRRRLEDTSREAPPLNLRRIAREQFGVNISADDVDDAQRFGAQAKSMAGRVLDGVKDAAAMGWNSGWIGKTVISGLGLIFGIRILQTALSLGKAAVQPKTWGRVGIAAAAGLGLLYAANHFDWFGSKERNTPDSEYGYGSDLGDRLGADDEHAALAPADLSTPGLAQTETAAAMVTDPRSVRDLPGITADVSEDVIALENARDAYNADQIALMAASADADPVIVNEVKTQEHGGGLPTITAALYTSDPFNGEEIAYVNMSELSRDGIMAINAEGQDFVAGSGPGITGPAMASLTGATDLSQRGDETRPSYAVQEILDATEGFTVAYNMLPLGEMDEERRQSETVGSKGIAPDADLSEEITAAPLNYASLLEPEGPSAA